MKKSVPKHDCRESTTCCCYLLADEPDEECPVHGGGTWPPRCEVCGRFMKRKAYDVEYYHGNFGGNALPPSI